MASQSKSDSARENGKKSRGPVTPQGKKNSSRNALKHGLTADFLVPGESEQDFAELLQAHQDSYQPANAVEMDLVQSMALARWRLRRIAMLESSLFENELALCRKEIDEEFETISNLGRLAFVFQQQTNSLALLIRYESSLTRLHDRTYKHLKELQKLRNEPTNPLKPRRGLRPASKNLDDAPTPEMEPRLPGAVSAELFTQPAVISPPRQSVYGKTALAPVITGGAGVQAKGFLPVGYDSQL